MNYLVLIAGMVVVTYIPRMLPMALIRDARLPKIVERFLRVLPAAALGALLIPGAFSAIPEHPMIGTAAVVAASAAALLRGGMVLAVIAGVGTALLLAIIF